ncbi:hypothetical protein QQP08_005375, partial [Theobroma cacao]
FIQWIIQPVGLRLDPSNCSDFQNNGSIVVNCLITGSTLVVVSGRIQNLKNTLTSPLSRPPSKRPHRPRFPDCSC